MIRYLLLYMMGWGVLVTPLAAQSIDENRRTFRETYDKQEVYIKMRDGVRLFTSIYTPKDRSEAHPILMTRTPYSCSPYGPDEYRSRIPDSYMHLVEEGYIFVIQDVRGKYMSEGEYMDIRPFKPEKAEAEADDNSDTYDTIDWLVENVENNNGKVGIFGISYPGFYSTMSLPQAHPALKAVSPQAPVTDWFVGDDFHHNGAFFWMDAIRFYSSFGQPRPEPTTERASTMLGYTMEDNYAYFMDIGTVKAVKERFFGDSIAFWNEVVAHPDLDEFWKARLVTQYLTDITPAVLTVGGFFDAEDSYGPFAVYRAVEERNGSNTENRLVMGPWYHGQWARGEASRMGNPHWGFNTADYYKLGIELPFFNYYLKGEGEMTLPEASIFLTGENEWRAFDTWPPQNTVKQSLYFQPKGGLAFQASTTEESFDEYVSDPARPVPYTEDVHWGRTREYMTDDQRFAARRPDVMVYETEVLTEDITLVGPITADLFVSTTGTDADYVVKLIDVFPNRMPNYEENAKDVPMGGYQMMVRGDILRGRYRNSFERPEAFTPEEITEVTFTMPDVGHTFKKGHKIMIQVQNSWFPLVDRNPQQFINIYEANPEDFQQATHRIYHDASRPSQVEVMVLEE